MNNELEVITREVFEKEEADIIKTANEFLKIGQEPGKELTPLEMNQFIQLCKAFRLNPYKREIYAIVYGGKKRKCNIVIGYEVFVKRAYRSRMLDGWRVWTEGEINKESVTNSTLKACIEIHRKDWSHPFYHEVFFKEYVGLTFDFDAGKKVVNTIWTEKPLTMIKKVVIGQGFRLCVPEELEGIPYFEEELYGQDTPENRKQKIIQEGKPLPVPEEIKKEIEAKNQIESIPSAADMANNLLKDVAEFQLSGDMTEEEKAQAIEEEKKIYLKEHPELLKGSL